MNFSLILDGLPGPPALCPNATSKLFRLTPFQPLLPLNLAVTVTFAEKAAKAAPGKFYPAVLSSLLAMKPGLSHMEIIGSHPPLRKTSHVLVDTKPKNRIGNRAESKRERSAPALDAQCSMDPSASVLFSKCDSPAMKPRGLDTPGASAYFRAGCLALGLIEC